MTHACQSFINRPSNSYRPLACKPVILQNRDIKGSGRQNKQDFFLLTKANTIRERATLDLLYPTPDWLRYALQPEPRMDYARVTSGGNERETTDDFLRITYE